MPDEPIADLVADTMTIEISIKTPHIIINVLSGRKFCNCFVRALTRARARLPALWAVTPAVLQLPHCKHTKSLQLCDW